MAGRNFLFVPGPSNVPDRVLRAMMVAMEDHRSPVFPELSRACLNGLKTVFKTVTGSAIIFPSSGTGCWEAALTNCLNPGDKVLTSRFGQFSHLWADMCTRLGFEVELLEAPWGEGVSSSFQRETPGVCRPHILLGIWQASLRLLTGAHSARSTSEVAWPIPTGA